MGTQMQETGNTSSLDIHCITSSSLVNTLTCKIISREVTWLLEEWYIILWHFSWIKRPQTWKPQDCNIAGVECIVYFCFLKLCFLKKRCHMSYLVLCSVQRNFARSKSSKTTSLPEEQTKRFKKMISNLIGWLAHYLPENIFFFF